MERGFDLPAPDPAALAHSERLAALIRERIRLAGGWLDFSDYMDLALYAPGFGYYQAGTAKFGAAGDFVTAPEISPLFARCLARACARILEGLGGGMIVELGGGSGVLAAELLNTLARRGVLPERYLMLEPSGELRERQQATIAAQAGHHLARVGWLDRLPEMGVQGVMFANEVADALPVSRFVMARGEPMALGVGLEGEDFYWSEAPARAALESAVGSLQRALPAPLPDGYRSEVCLRLPGWITTLAAALRRGALLLFDYGLSRKEYYHPQRSDGTLLCHYRHRAHADPFRYPGLQDITAWVDFTAVAEAADTEGLWVAGYTTQAHFLLGNGLDRELAATAGGGAVAAAGEARRLLLPGQMGEGFKVMALTRDPNLGVPGYDIRDLRHML